MTRFGMLLAASFVMIFGVMLAPATALAEPPSTPAAVEHAAQAHDDHSHGAAAAHGDDHGHEALSALPSPKQGVVTGLTAILVFLVVLAVFATKVWPTMVKGLEDRSNKIRDEIQSAEMARKQAKDALEQYEASLKDARAEAQKMLEKARAQQQVLLDEMKQKNEAELVVMREKARRDIEAAKKEALADIYSQAGDLASTAASKILRREVNAGDTRRLMDETMTELAGSRR